MVIDQNGVEYFQAFDFNLDPNGSISWISGRGPEKTVIYAIHYEASVQFIASLRQIR